MTSLDGLSHHRRDIDVGALAPGLEGYRVAADVFLPACSQVYSPAFCCLPGGGASRRYWDLRPPGDDGYSFAVHMARAGFPVICLDHLGTGESALPRPAEPPLLGQVVAANDAAFRLLLGELRHTVAGLRSVGVGHSMGAVLTVRQQARHGTHDAIALLGFSIKGLPSVLPPEILAACSEGIPGDVELAELTLRKFGSAYPDLNRGGTDPAVPDPLRRALKEYATVLLGAGGMLSLLPGNVASDAAEVRVPVLLANGDRDALVGGGPPPTSPYSRATQITAFVVPEAGHNLTIAPARHRLWNRLLRWAKESAIRDDTEAESQ
ncbi:MAG: alpha/beta hydrolase [Streptosporangiaceae bacterium]|nr:alpha/beta hydrolase [Streptosporangiaceae bacterium]